MSDDYQKQYDEWYENLNPFVKYFTKKINRPITEDDIIITIKSDKIVNVYPLSSMGSSTAGKQLCIYIETNKLTKKERIYIHDADGAKLYIKGSIKDIDKGRTVCENGKGLIDEVKYYPFDEHKHGRGLKIL